MMHAIDDLVTDCRLFVRGLKKFIIFRIFRSFSPADQHHVIRCLESRLKVGSRK